MAKAITAYTHNCFTIGRFGEPTAGIKLDTSPGADPLRPLLARLVLGYRFVTLDRFKPAEVDNGTVFLSEVTTVRPDPTKAGFSNLARPMAERPTTSLIHVNYLLPGKKVMVKIDGLPVNPYTGVAGGQVVESSRVGALIQLVEGEAVTIFFEDGAVRKFRRQGQLLVESYFNTADEMLTERIQQAHNLLEEELGFDFTKSVLFGVIDLLHMTTRFNQRGLGQGMRLRILREFFLELPADLRPLCWGRLGLVLKQIDPVLCHVLYNTPSAEVVDISERREQVAAMSPKDPAAQKEANRLHDQKAREEKKARQRLFSEQRRAKAVTKAVPKQGKKQKKAA